MTSDQVLDIFSQALLVAMKLAMPMLLVIAVLLLLTGSWMISVMNDFVHWLFSVILTI